MEKIEKGKYIEIVYDLYKINPDGSEELVHQVDPADPETLVYGVLQGVVGPLEKALEGLAAGDAFDVTATAAEAFGERNDEYIQDLDKEIFTVDGVFDDEMVRPGNSLPMMTADGMRIYGTVVDVTPDTVKLDFNHPLAGMPVRFKGSVKTVRDASDDELRAATSGCCCSGGCGSADGACESGCQGGCQA